MTQLSTVQEKEAWIYLGLHPKDSLTILEASSSYLYPLPKLKSQKLPVHKSTHLSQKVHVDAYARGCLAVVTRRLE